jgi:hypothetical protein
VQTGACGVEWGGENQGIRVWSLLEIWSLKTTTIPALFFTLFAGQNGMKKLLNLVPLTTALTLSLKRNHTAYV